MKLKFATLQRWVVEYGGPRKLARDLGMSEDAIFRWLRREHSPAIAAMDRLIAISKKELTYESIIRSTKPRRRKVIKK